ncbi:MAG: hypothetical protein JXA14_22815, partial [Anaerolineae bacterium]|nr:hypothetical protein [Anaerolineae bacterium]
QQDDEFTVTEFITAGGAENTSTAWRRLSRLVENGELTRRMVCGRENGRQAWAFRMVNERSGNAPGWRDGSGPDQE